MEFLHIIADYGPGDLAFSEIQAVFAGLLPGLRTVTTTAPSFNTVSTGFLVAQLGSDPYLSGKGAVFANCAPRADDATEREDNEGEGLLLALTRHDIPLFVVNSGYSLSFLKEDIQELWQLEVSSAGSQFRSRDNFPVAVAKVLQGDESIKKAKLPLTHIPDPPRLQIGYVDSFGNLKTTLRTGDSLLDKFEPGQRIAIRINGIRRSAQVAGGSFQVEEGDIAFAPGSSGRQRPFWEIFQRGGSAWQTYGAPLPGAPLELGDCLPLDLSGRSGA